MKAFGKRNNSRAVWAHSALRNAKGTRPGSEIRDSNTCPLSTNVPESKREFYFFFFFFSQLELTFTLAANETKQRSVIRVNVLIRGFHGKLIS